MNWGFRGGVVALAFGIGVAQAAPPDLQGPASAWVLADQASRDAGLVLEVSGQSIDATMPVEVEQDLELAVIDGPRSRRAWMQGQLLYLVTGRQGTLRATRPGIDVETDIVAIYADEVTAQALADDVGAVLERDRRRWLLHGDDLLFELAYVAVPDATIDVTPVAVVPDGKSDAQRPKRIASRRLPVKRTKKTRRKRIARRARVHAPLAGAEGAKPWTLSVSDQTAEPVSDAERSAGLVGWYCHATTCIVLGIDGRARRCNEQRCVDMGPWAERPDGIEVGNRPYIWKSGYLVPAPEVKQ
ncbi:MAG: hypothetical protein AAGA48_09155 [Myxococcota bacterium]